MRIAKTILCLLLLISGLGLVGIGIWEAIATGVWSWLFISLFGALFGLGGYEITTGGSIKETLKELFSAFSYWS